MNTEKSFGFICLACSRRLINAHMLKFEIEKNINFSIQESEPNAIEENLVVNQTLDISTEDSA